MKHCMDKNLLKNKERKNKLDFIVIFYEAFKFTVTNIWNFEDPLW